MLDGVAAEALGGGKSGGSVVGVLGDDGVGGAAAQGTGGVGGRDHGVFRGVVFWECVHGDHDIFHPWETTGHVTGIVMGTGAAGMIDDGTAAAAAPGTAGVMRLPIDVAMTGIVQGMTGMVVIEGIIKGRIGARGVEKGRAQCQWMWTLRLQRLMHCVPNWVSSRCVVEKGSG